MSQLNPSLIPSTIRQSYYLYKQQSLVVSLLKVIIQLSKKIPIMKMIIYSISLLLMISSKLQEEISEPQSNLLKNVFQLKKKIKLS